MHSLADIKLFEFPFNVISVFMISDASNTDIFRMEIVTFSMRFVFSHFNNRGYDLFGDSATFP